MGDDDQQATKAAAAAEKRPRGRPKKVIDLELVEKLAHIQCTYGEIASTLGVSVDTLQRHKDFAATYKRGAEGGRKSLRRMQFESANRGNVVMQIWLGKQYLGQKDHEVNEIRTLPSFADLTLDELCAGIQEFMARNPGLTSQMRAIDADFEVVPGQRRRSLPRVGLNGGEG